MRCSFLSLALFLAATIAAAEGSFPTALRGTFEAPCDLATVQAALPAGQSCTADQLAVLNIPNRPHFVLEEPYSYEKPNGQVFSVPPGFVVDGASIPNVVWSLVGGPFSGNDLKASVVHDYYVFICTDGEDQVLNDCALQLQGDHPSAQEVHMNYFRGMRAGGTSEELAMVKLFAVCINKYWTFAEGTRRPEKVHNIALEDPLTFRSLAAAIRGYRLIWSLLNNPSVQGLADGIGEVYGSPEDACKGARDLQGSFNTNTYDALAAYHIPLAYSATAEETRFEAPSLDLISFVERERSNALSIIQTDAIGGFDLVEFQRISGRTSLAPEDALIMVPNLSMDRQQAGYRMLSGEEFISNAVAVSPVGSALTADLQINTLSQPENFTALLTGQPAPDLTTVGVFTDIGRFATFESADQEVFFGRLSGPGAGFEEGILLNAPPQTGLAIDPTFTFPLGSFDADAFAGIDGLTIDVPTVDENGDGARFSGGEITLNQNLQDLLARSGTTPNPFAPDSTLPFPFSTTTPTVPLTPLATDPDDQSAFSRGLVDSFSATGGVILPLDDGPAITEGLGQGANAPLLYLAPLQ